MYADAGNLKCFDFYKLFTEVAAERREKHILFKLLPTDCFNLIFCVLCIYFIEFRYRLRVNIPPQL